MEYFGLFFFIGVVNVGIRFIGLVCSVESRGLSERLVTGVPISSDKRASKQTGLQNIDVDVRDRLLLLCPFEGVISQSKTNKKRGYRQTMKKNPVVSP